MTARPYLFTFWDSPDPMPAYIRLCRDSVFAHLSGAFEIIDLDFDSCADWVPERDQLWQAATPLTEGRSASRTGRHFAQFTGMLRVALLARHGGLWLDADQLVFDRFAHLAPLVRSSDLLAPETAEGTLSNPVLGAAPGSEFAAALWQAICQRLDEKAEAGETGARWGEMGFRLLNRVWQDTPPKRPYIAPFGSLITADTAQPTSVFAPGSGRKDALPPIALGLSVFNNAVGPDLRRQNAAELLAADTLFALCARAARGEDVLEGWLMIDSTAQLAALNRAPLITYLADKADTAQALRDKLDRAHDKIARLKEVNRKLKAK
jgi:hypothetical protein